MTILRNEQLAEVLWRRSKEFAAKQDYYNAIVDISASFRLFSLSQDPRCNDVRKEWEGYYQKLTSEENPRSELETLIQRVRDRKRTESNLSLD